MEKRIIDLWTYLSCMYPEIAYEDVFIYNEFMDIIAKLKEANNDNR